MNTEFLKLLVRTLQTAKILGIENFLIESDTIRGIDDNKFIFMHSTHDIDLEFNSVGVTRASLLYNRLKLIDVERCNIDINIKNGFLGSFNIKDKKHKLNIICSNPTLITSPKGIKDNTKYTLSIPDDTISEYNSYLNAMKTDNVYMIHDNSSIFFEFIDINKDTLTCNLDIDNLTSIDNSALSNFKYMYDSKSLQLILKNCSTNIAFTNRGFIKVNINGITVWLSPKIV